jgi:hypothetical protein
VDVLEPEDAMTDNGVGRIIGREIAALVVIGLIIVGLAVWVARRGAAGEGAGSAEVTAPRTSLATYAGHHSAVYDDPAHWVCRPGRSDACSQDLDTTVIGADGSTSMERFVPDAQAPIDCFYVYPTVSKDPAASSDLTPAADQEGAAAYLQAARFGSVCRVFAPVYRQRTMTDLLGGVPGSTSGPTTSTAPPTSAPSKSGASKRGAATTTPAPPTTTTAAASATTTTTWPSPYDGAYDDVLDAFKEYIANDNHGRGFVLIGQAQGSTLLNALIQREIAPNLELRDHLVSAVLAGFPVTVDSGDPESVPACRKPGQLACVISFAAFRKTSPPPADAAYGRGRICTNPAALGGARATLHSYFPTDRHLPFIDPKLSPTGPPWLIGPSAPPITTPFVSTPGLLEGECVTRGPFTYLEVTVHGDPSDPRTDDITGDLVPSWGLHLVDFDLVMGDLLDAVRQQRDVYEHH